MSPVFKDMFSFASVKTEKPSPGPLQHAPLKLAERSEVIELLLEHIDPKSKRVLPINQDTILELLEAARKYQVTTITDWFLEQVALPQIDSSSGEPVVTASFSSNHPDLVLQAALRFEFPHVGRVALRELAGGPPPKMSFETAEVTPRVYKYQCQLREARVEHYRAYITLISKGVKTTLRNSGRTPCCNCIGFLGEWFLNMERAIVLSPRWRSFSTAFGNGLPPARGGCPSCRTNWTESFREKMDQWEKESTTIESELPDWPF
ncbi:hypothetical protein M408DRAFT_327693 [Serendipita vermifera MAFF 305830]|uniref:BTB domain-containing protein n=1 Tax=Serendipita vermifera MAFF 305830 TaxID=933852 RepID=A0A0C3BH55_SERVB|nr:hypothetical protein M408DRAFT_327693 [Serendipita vermifera MAFF 305830]